MSLSEFEKHTTISENKDGSYAIKCNKGLWSVTAPNKSRATQEAVHYFLQYWHDGEYAENPLEAIMHHINKDLPVGGQP